MPKKIAVDSTLERYGLLADNLARRICYRGIGTASASGIFVALPSDVDISKFVHDLCNALKPTGAQVLHVILQQQQDQSSAFLIENIIRETFAGNVVPHGNSAGMTCTRSQEAEQGGFANALVTLSQALLTLIILVIENAQYLVTGKDSDVVLCGLKAVRDELNASGQHGLRIAFIGEDFDALAGLRGDQRQAFFCAPIVSLRQV